ncbi:hypothetical protein GCM10027592_42980 [Spirosoma flavus]
MKSSLFCLLVLFWLTSALSRAQSPSLAAAVELSAQQNQPVQKIPLRGYFLTDSIEIGRPFQYSLTYWHPTSSEILFPDTARHFAPYRVQNVATFTTKTIGTGALSLSRDSAVYTLVSFETESVQRLRVPVRILHELDCTAYWTQTDTVYLRSKLPITLTDSSRRQLLKLATSTKLAPLQQEFNYALLATGFLVISVVIGLLYALFGNTIRRQWRLYLLHRQHINFLRNYNRLITRLTSFTAAETANQAVVMWKFYLELIDGQPYTALTTPELAERLNDERIANALREADRMIYGSAFSDQSFVALQVLSDVATQTYHRTRDRLLRSKRLSVTTSVPADSVDSSSLS